MREESLWAILEAAYESIYLPIPLKSGCLMPFFRLLFSQEDHGNFLAPMVLMSRIVLCWAVTFVAGPSLFLLFEAFRQRLAGHLRAHGQLSSDWPPGHLNTASKIAWGACQGARCCCRRNTFCSLAFAGNCSPREINSSCEGGGGCHLIVTCRDDLECMLRMKCKRFY